MIVIGRVLRVILKDVMVLVQKQIVRQYSMIVVFVMVLVIQKVPVTVMEM
jgi:hypothetical protein